MKLQGRCPHVGENQTNYIAPPEFYSAPLGQLNHEDWEPHE